MTTQATLPSLPSELILVAMHDLELCEADPKYQVNMGNWHRPLGDVCSVCLAGAVMAQELDFPVTKYINVIFVNKSKNSNKLKALDNFRSGFIGSAFEELGISMFKAREFIRGIATYTKDNTEFKEDMHMLAFDLWDAGF